MKFAKLRFGDDFGDARKFLPAKVSAFKVETGEYIKAIPILLRHFQYGDKSLTDEIKKFLISNEQYFET